MEVRRTRLGRSTEESAHHRGSHYITSTSATQIAPSYSSNVTPLSSQSRGAPSTRNRTRPSDMRGSDCSGGGTSNTHSTLHAVSSAGSTTFGNRLRPMYRRVGGSARVPRALGDLHRMRASCQSIAHGTGVRGIICSTGVARAPRRADIGACHACPIPSVVRPPLSGVNILTASAGTSTRTTALPGPCAAPQALAACAVFVKYFPSLPLATAPARRRPPCAPMSAASAALTPR